MRYGIDCDGVVCDFVSGFVREVNLIWPGKLPIGYQPDTWDWSPALTSDESSQVWDTIAKKHNWWLSLPPCFDNVRALAIHRIHYPGDEIFYVTARKATNGMPTMHQTQTWLNQCGIGGLGTAVIVDEDSNKVPIFNALQCDANIDDKLEAVIAHDRETSGACLLDRPWNRHDRPSGIRVVNSLGEFFRRASEVYATSK